MGGTGVEHRLCSEPTAQALQTLPTAGTGLTLSYGGWHRTAIEFGIDGWRDVPELLSIFGECNPTPKTFVSLCCKTGDADFGGAFSQSTICHSLLAPFHSVHGAIASQFCQTFFSHHLLSGKSVTVAFNKSRNAIPEGTHFRLWKNGHLTGDH